jgi:hypothetical protein
VDDSETLAETRRALALVLPPRESNEDPVLDDAEQAGRQREDDVVDLALAEDEFAPRGPPGELDPFLGLPDEVARGQPENGELADLSRGPPPSDSFEFGLLEDHLPGFEDSAAARTEPLQSIKSIPDAILGRPFGGVTGSVSENQTNKSPTTLSAPGSVTNHEENTGRIVLGYVRLLDGRQRIVVSVGDSVMLVEEAVAVQSNRPASAGNQTLSSHPQAGGAHQTLGEPSGSVLQSGTPIRDNQRQLHQ